MVYKYLAIGDSLTAGIGDPAEIGYAPRYQQMVQRKLKVPLLFERVGLPGLTTGDLLYILQTDPDVRIMVRQANLITITAGGNDLIGAAKRVLKDSNPTHLEKALQLSRYNFDRILECMERLTGHRLTTAGPNVVRIANLYNPLPEYPETGKWVSAFNRYIQSLASPSIAIVNLNRLVAGREKELLAPDRIHLNGRGYKAMAVQLDQLGYGSLSS